MLVVTLYTVRKILATEQAEVLGVERGGGGVEVYSVLLEFLFQSCVKIFTAWRRLDKILRQKVFFFRSRQKRGRFRKFNFSSERSRAAKSRFWN